MQRRLHHTFVLALGLVASAAIAVQPSLAQEKFPSRFVKIITTTGTGTGPDVILRTVAEALSREWGQQVVVENNSTGGGMVAATVVSQAPTDGYTLLAASASAYTVLPIRQEKAPVVVGTHLKPIGYLGDQPLIIAVLPSLRVSSVAELVALAKKDPDKVLYAANATGTLPHMTGELLKSVTGAPYRFVPYRGGSEGLKDMLSGNVNMIIDGLPALEGTLRSGHIKAIAVTSTKRLDNMPDVPPIADTVPGFRAIGWSSLAAPAGVPDAIVAQINADMNRVMQKPETTKRILELGTFVVPMSTAQLTQFIKSEQERWWPIVRKLLAQPAAATGGK